MVWTISREHRVAAQRVVRRRHVEQQRLAALHGGGERLVGFRRRIDQEELDAALGHRLGDGAGDLFGRLHGDAFEHEIGVEHARQRLRLVDPDLGAGEGMAASLEDEALIGAHRLVARVAIDVDEADGDALARRLRLGRLGRRCRRRRWRCWLRYRRDARAGERQCEQRRTQKSPL